MDNFIDGSFLHELIRNHICYASTSDMKAKNQIYKNKNCKSKITDSGTDYGVRMPILMLTQ